MVALLTQRLRNVPAVARLDAPNEPQASTIAYSLAELERSFREVVNNQLPRLLDQTLGERQLYETLLDIGEEFRHILYHLKDAAFYSYLVDDESAGKVADSK
jgi:hypothetical protein